jgi:hypothetical protein
VRQSQVFDARHGLSAEAISELRHADELALAVKDATTAILGYWVHEVGPNGLPNERMGAVVLPSEVAPNAAAAPMRIQRAQLHGGWQGLVRGYLHPGDTPVAAVWRAELCLRVGPLRTPAQPDRLTFVHVRGGPPVYRRLYPKRRPQ